MSTAISRSKRRDRIARFEAEYQAVRREFSDAGVRLQELAGKPPVMAVLGVVGMLVVIFLVGTIEAS